MKGYVQTIFLKEGADEQENRERRWRASNEAIDFKEKTVQKLHKEIQDIGFKEHEWCSLIVERLLEKLPREKGYYEQKIEEAHANNLEETQVFNEVWASMRYCVADEIDSYEKALVEAKKKRAFIMRESKVATALLLPTVGVLHSTVDPRFSLAPEKDAFFTVESKKSDLKTSAVFAINLVEKPISAMVTAMSLCM